MSCKIIKVTNRYIKEKEENTKVYKEYNATWISPGMSTWESHPLTSFPRHCRTLRSSWELRREWPAGAWRRIRIHPPQPAITCVVRVLRIINSFQYFCLETGAVPASTLFTSLIFRRTLLEFLESNQCNVSLPQYWKGQFLTFHISRNWFVIMFVMIIQD